MFQLNYGKLQEVVSNLWAINSKSNHLRKKIFVGYNYHRLERRLCDFEWDHNTIAYIGQHSSQTYVQAQMHMRKRSLLLHVMLRQGTSWYALDNVEYLLPPPHLEELEI